MNLFLFKFEQNLRLLYLLAYDHPPFFLVNRFERKVEVMGHIYFFNLSIKKT